MVEKQIVEIQQQPEIHENIMDCHFTWSLRVLAGFIMEEMKLIDDGISHTEIRNILLKHRIRQRKSKMVLGNSKDPEYDIKKVH